GEHGGNTFTIIARNISKITSPGVKNLDVPNFFGEQRFQYGNADVGRFLVKKKFGEAADMIAENNRLFAKHYEKKKSDAVGALLKLPKHILMIYLHAYQSMLWNQARATLGHNAPEKLVVIGFGTEFDNVRDDVREIYEELLEKEDLSPRDFIIKQLRGLSPEGETRKSTLSVEIEVGAPENDDCFPGKKKQEIKFSLPTGAYATVVVQQLFA
ncbi:tRNA pseudouridine(13) synthase TruD, partial [Candidatus Woesearchaeota archaeon]|nr:tRNA pseudouridine(13) synthase TruD [Candidatus Woesearchaeota archaeon]